MCVDMWSESAVAVAGFVGMWVTRRVIHISTK